VTLDKGTSWRRLKANFPTVRVDEITLHPRENAMLVASHGRALWILDNLAPIQEFAAAQQPSAGDVTLFSIANTIQMKTTDNQNDEFWGHQFFTGENPPVDAVISFHLKRAVGTLALRISDNGGRQVRELAIPAARNQPGIQTVCWDMRFDPVPAIDAPPSAVPPAAAGGGGPPGGRGAGAGAGAGAGGGRAGGGAARGGGAGRGGAGGGIGAPPSPAGQPQPGYMPANPCGGGGGGGGSAGPHVMPGTYSVALLVDGRVVDTKPMTIVMDPQVQFNRAGWQSLVNKLGGRYGQDARAGADVEN
jgi:hypothetical protein